MPIQPSPAEDDVTARGRWWSRRFTDLLESYGDEERLARGRSYARTGQVADLRISAHEVTACVRGSEPEPYDVAVGIDVIDEAVWETIEEALASQAVFRARLLAGEMPPEIENVFAAFGVALFPVSPDAMHVMCSCPDWGEACEHAAAVLYLLAEAFDEDPFLILAWHGRTRERLLTGLRRKEPLTTDPLEVEEAPIADRLEDFWAPAAVRDRPPAPAMPPGLLLRQLDPPKVKVRRRDLPDVLRPAYDALSEL
jgi:uncharacterized Zn finger protein